MVHKSQVMWGPGLTVTAMETSVLNPAAAFVNQAGVAPTAPSPKTAPKTAPKTRVTVSTANACVIKAFLGRTAPCNPAWSIVVPMVSAWTAFAFVPMDILVKTASKRNALITVLVMVAVRMGRAFAINLGADLIALNSYVQMTASIVDAVSMVLAFATKATQVAIVESVPV